MNCLDLLRANLSHSRLLIETLRQRGLRDSTIALACHGINSLYRELDAMGVEGVRLPFVGLVSNSLSKRKIPERRAPVLSDEQIMSLYDTIGTSSPRALQYRALISLLFYAGLRISEAINLEWCDIIKGEPCLLVLRDTKTSNYHEHAVPDWIVDDLLALRSLGGADRPFTIHVNTAHAALKRYADRAGIKGFSSHSGRRTAITRLLDMGYSHREVQIFSRHTTVKMVERYDAGIRNQRLNPGRLFQRPGIDRHKK